MIEINQTASKANNNLTQRFANKASIIKTRVETVKSTELRLPFQTLASTTATTQISALVFCLAWSVRFNFHESTATHCKVDNYLPSLSATLDFTPQRDVWRSCIGLSSLPRYFIAYLYYRIIFNSLTLLCLHWLEITALIGLSIVDSIRYFRFHATCVGIFLLTSIIHMCFVCFNITRPMGSMLTTRTKRNLVKTKLVKTRIAVVNFLAIIIALYLYDRHNRYCEPGVYSLFSFLEYIVIVANIIYHLQAYHDLEEYSILIAMIYRHKQDMCLAELSIIQGPTGLNLSAYPDNKIRITHRDEATSLITEFRSGLITPEKVGRSDL